MNIVEFITPAVLVLGVTLAIRHKQSNGPARDRLGLLPEEWSDRLRPHRTRRALVAIWVISLIAGNILAFGLFSGAPFVLMGAWWTGIAITQSTRGMAERKADELDERMLAARNSAFRVAYYSIGGAIAAAAILAAVQGEDITLQRGVLVTGGFTIALLVGYLPAVVIAWTERNV